MKSMFSVTITSRAERELRRLDRPVKQDRDRHPLPGFGSPPLWMPQGQSEEGVWRVRIGDWRVGYIIDDEKREVVVIRVGHRSELYN